MHGPAVKMGKDNASGIKTRIGLILFIFYSLVYAGFVLINTIKPKLMEVNIIFGLNLAVVYGFGLIVFAIVLGLIYNQYCTRKEDELNKPESEE